MLAIFASTLPFFALIGCGWLAGRFRVLPQAGIAGLNTFVFWFALPAQLFRPIAVRSLAEIWNPPFLAAYGLSGIVLFAAAALAGRALFRLGPGEWPVHALASAMSNSGYLGVPLLLSLMGEGAALPVALTLLMDLACIVPVTVVLVARSRREGAEPPRVLRELASNPMLLSVLAGIAVSASGLSLPAPVLTFVQVLGNAAGPCALFALGASLVGGPAARGTGEVALISAMKLGVHPLLVWLAVTALFPVDPVWGKAAVLIAALPSAGTAFVLAQRYDRYVRRASTAILVSTVISVITVPLALLLL